MLANSDWARLIAPPTTHHLIPYANAMAKGDDRWFNRVEQFVASTKKDNRLLTFCKHHHLEAMVRLD